MSGTYHISIWNKLPRRVRLSLHESFADNLDAHGADVLDEMILFIVAVVTGRGGDMSDVRERFDRVQAELSRADLHEEVASPLAPWVEGIH